jgi:hypothetical protein
MKKDIILKEEIGRIHELMSVSLSEIDTLDFLIESTLILESILPDLLRAGIDAADNLVQSGKRLSPEIQKYLNDLSIAADDIAKLKAIGNLMDESAEIFNSVYSVYTRVNKSQLDTVSTNIDKALNGASPKDFKKIQDRLNQIVEIQARQLTRQIPSQKLAKELENGWKKQIKDFNKYNVSVPSTSLNQSVKVWMTKAFPNLGTVKNMIINTFKSFDALQDEFLELDKLATAKLRAGRDATVEIKRMADIVASINKKEGKLAEEVWNNMTTDGQKGWKNAISNEVYSKLAFDKKGKPWDGIIEAITATDDEIKTAKSAYLDIFKPSSYKKGEGWQRIFSYLTYGDPRKPAELIKYMQTAGLPLYVIERAVAFFVITPLILSFVKNAIPASKSGLEYAMQDKGGERPDYTSWGEGQEWWEPWWESYKDSIPGDGLWESIGKFLTPWALDEVWSIATATLGGLQDPDVEKLRLKYDNDYRKFKDGLPDEEREKLEQAENEAGLGDETITPTETPIKNPIEKEIRDGFPCAKKYPLKVISNTKVEFTNVSSGNEIILAEKINGVWTWTDTGLPLKCNK